MRCRIDDTSARGNEIAAHRVVVYRGRVMWVARSMGFGCGARGEFGAGG